MQITHRLLPTNGLLPAIIGSTQLGISLTLFIYSFGPVSGGHLNPAISIAVFLAQLASFPRTAIYVLLQCVGALIGSFLIRAATGAALPVHVSSVVHGLMYRL